MLTDLPNLLTLSRIAAIPLLVGIVAVHTPAADFLACVVFSAAAITDYLDEKGLEARNMFAEEYLNRTKTSDDPSLEVDILVFLK